MQLGTLHIGVANGNGYLDLQNNSTTAGHDLRTCGNRRFTTDTQPIDVMVAHTNAGMMKSTTSSTPHNNSPIHLLLAPYFNSHTTPLHGQPWRTSSSTTSTSNSNIDVDKFHPPPSPSVLPTLQTTSKQEPGHSEPTQTRISNNYQHYPRPSSIPWTQLATNTTMWNKIEDDFVLFATSGTNNIDTKEMDEQKDLASHVIL